MSRVFVGDISVEASRLLSKYLDKYMPDAVIEPLKTTGIKGKIKNHATRSDVVLVILSENLFDMCLGVADNVLSLPKVHKYVSDAGFKEFLEKKFGVLDNSVESEVITDDFDDLTVSDNDETPDDNDKDEVIRKLNDELIVCNTLIRNLEAQIEEKTADNDVSHFVKRIKTLESELEIAKAESSKLQNDSYAELGKVARAEQIIEKVDKLTEDLKSERKKYANLESEKLSLEIEIKSLTSEYDELNGNYTINQTKLSELEESLSSIQKDYDDKVKELEELSSSSSDLEVKVKDLTTELAGLKVLEEEISSLSESNKKLNEEVTELKGVRINLSNLQVDYDKVSKEKEVLDSKIAELNSTIDALKEELKTSSSTQETMDKLTKELSDAKASVESLTSLKSSLEVNLSTLTKEKEELVSQVNELSLKLSSKDDEIDGLIKNLDKTEGVSLELKTSKEQVDKLLYEISTLNDSLTVKANELDSKIKELETLKVELDSVTNERNSLMTDLKSKESELSSVTSLSEEVTTLSEQLEISSKTITDLEVSNKKLTSEVELLRKEAIDSSTLLESSYALEGELKDSKRKIAKLESENDLLKQDLEKEKNSSSKDIEIAKLRSSISDYKEQIRVLQSSKSKEFDEELSQLRKRCADLEVSLIDKDNLLSAKNNSIFSKMGSIASPKTMLNVSIDIPKELPNMYVFASGSAESNIVTYQALKRICSSTNKSVLIVDLVTDSYIDRELGVGQVQSPIEFLQGIKPVNEVLAKSKIGNAYVLSIAFSYFNSLYLLNIDWGTVLPSLYGVADIIIINVGCLNDMVSKVLFNAFSTSMKSHIIIKASPINLRTALLSLTGIPSAKMSQISCVNFENSSKQMYQRLAQKFNTQILKDSDVLKL